MASAASAAAPMLPRRAALCAQLCDSVLREPGGARIVLYDGVCLVCNSFVNFVTDHDPELRVRFAPLESDVGRFVRARLAIPHMDSMLLVEGATAGKGLPLEAASWYCRSTAALRILVGLHPQWVFLLLWLLLLLPAPLRDLAYKLFAASRYKIFGTVHEDEDGGAEGGAGGGGKCRMVTKTTRPRFLDLVLKDMEKQQQQADRAGAGSSAAVAAEAGSSSSSSAAPSAPELSPEAPSAAVAAAAGAAARAELANASAPSAAAMEAAHEAQAKDEAATEAAASSLQQRKPKHTEL